MSLRNESLQIFLDAAFVAFDQFANTGGSPLHSTDFCGAGAPGNGACGGGRPIACVRSP